MKRAAMIDRKRAPKEDLFGPVSTPLQGQGEGGEHPADQVVTPQASPLDAFETRMVQEFGKRRTIAVTGFVPAAVKARLARIARAAEDAVGSRAFTESAQVRALAELVYELEVDWVEVLADVDPADPIPALKQVFRKLLVQA